MTMNIPPPMPGRAISADAQIAMLYDANKKSAVVAYLLWVFIGMIGGHRFYLARKGTGVLMLLLTAVGALSWFAGGAILVLIVALWAIVDAFVIPKWVAAINNALVLSLTAQR